MCKSVHILQNLISDSNMLNMSYYFALTSFDTAGSGSSKLPTQKHKSLDK